MDGISKGQISHAERLRKIIVFQPEDLDRGLMSCRLEDLVKEINFVPGQGTLILTGGYGRENGIIPTREPSQGKYIPTGRPGQIYNVIQTRGYSQGNTFRPEDNW